MTLTLTLTPTPDPNPNLHQVRQHVKALLVSIGSSLPQVTGALSLTLTPALTLTLTLTLTRCATRLASPSRRERRPRAAARLSLSQWFATRLGTQAQAARCWPWRIW